MTDPNRHEHRQPPWEPGSEADFPSFGSWLRRQRELREISLREVAEVTKISLRYLEALEQDEFDVLPAPVFAKGFLRQYAGYVGLNPDEVVNSYLTALQEREPDENQHEWSPPPKKPLWEWTSGLLLAVLVIALLALVAVLAFYAERRRVASDETPPPIAAPPVLLPTQTEGPSGSAGFESASPLLVTMEFTEDCWVEASVDDESRLGGFHVQGESLKIEAERVVRLTLNNPAAVRIEVNGEPFTVSESPDGTVRDLEIALDKLYAPSMETE